MDSGLLLYLCVDFALLLVGLCVVLYLLRRIAELEKAVNQPKFHDVVPLKGATLKKNRTFWDEPLNK